jgi:hypothetical protein
VEGCGLERTAHEMRADLPLALARAPGGNAVRCATGIVPCQDCRRQGTPQRELVISHRPGTPARGTMRRRLCSLAWRSRAFPDSLEGASEPGRSRNQLASRHPTPIAARVSCRHLDGIFESRKSPVTGLLLIRRQYISPSSLPPLPLTTSLNFFE